MLFSDPVIFILAIFILLFIILLAVILLAPFSLSLNIGKKGPLAWVSIKLAWLGITLRKVEITPQSADDLLATIWKEEAGKEERVVGRRMADGMVMAVENEQREIKGQEQDEKEPVGGREGIRKVIDSEKTDTIHPPGIKPLIDAAPALAKILWGLKRSIHLNKSSCHLCFGLNDPAQTAIVSGYLWFLSSALGSFPAKIIIDPWFEGERLEGEIIAEIEARLLWPIFAMIKAMRVREIRLLLKEILGWT